MHGGNLCASTFLRSPSFKSSLISGWKSGSASTPGETLLAINVLPYFKWEQINKMWLNENNLLVSVLKRSLLWHESQYYRPNGKKMIFILLETCGETRKHMVRFPCPDVLYTLICDIHLVLFLCILRILVYL